MKFYCDVYCVLYTKEEPNFAPVPCHQVRLGGRGSKECGEGGSGLLSFYEGMDDIKIISYLATKKCESIRDDNL